MKLRLLFSILLFSVISFAQNGTVSGVILDKEMNNEPLPFANVMIKGSPQGTTTDENGKYSLTLKPGNYTIIFGYLGYENKEIAFSLKANEKKIINHTLEASGVQLKDIEIVQTILKEKESVLLQEQQKAVEFKQAIGAQELSRKGVSNAEAAVTKTSGVTKQQGVKNVIVRGLGDRYNSTSLNGLALPSDDPEYKNISLDFFGSELIQNVSINKTFSSNFLGDVGGANIDITSKELGKDKEIDINFSNGINTQTLGENFKLIDGTNWFGTQRTKNTISSITVYDFKNNLKPNEQNLQINNGFSISGGRKFNIGKGKLSLFLVGSLDNNYLYTEGNIKQTNSLGQVYLNQNFNKYNYNVSQLVMNNMKYKFGDGNSIALNNILIHNNNQSYGDYFGENNPEQTGDLELLVRQQVNDNLLFVNQLIGDFKLSEKIKYHIGLAFNTVTGNEPDRRSNNYLFRDGFFAPQTNSAGENERFYSNLKEKDYVANSFFTYDFGGENKTRIFELGGDVRYTKRDFQSIIFNHDFSTRTEIDVNNPDLIFNQASLDNGIFELETGRGTASNPRVFDPFTYNAVRFIGAGYGKYTHSFNENLVALVGLRGEFAFQEAKYDTNISNSATNGKANLEDLYLLPSLSLKYNFNENSILRFSSSKTYTYPQFKEIAPFKYQDVSFSSQGNPDLEPSENYNFDLKYERFFGNGELFSITGFGKQILNPIARSEIPSGGNTLTYLNIGERANVFGIELELRKNIINSQENETNKNLLSFGLNASYLFSEVNLDRNSVAQFTKKTSELEGATPLLINSDLTYTRKFKNESSLTSTLILNYFSDRVYSIGTRGFENIIEKSIPTLDFVAKLNLNKNYSLSLKGQNLLNPDFQLSRDGANNGENVVLRDFKRGVNLSLGFGISF